MIPPDPIGAAGPSHLVSVVNTVIQWFTKDGTLQHTQRLGMNSVNNTGSFFESLNPFSTTFDPKVIYDQYNNRFIVVALEYDTSPDTSRILLAVSQTNDPNDGWYFYAVDAKTSVNGVDMWADYPGLAVGPNSIFITSNLFPFVSSLNASATKLWIVDKTPLYSGGTPSVYSYDPVSVLGSGVYYITMQPAHMFGTPPANIQTFLVQYSGLSNVNNNFLGVIKVQGTSSAATFTQSYVLLSDIDSVQLAMANASQLGTTSKISTNDRRTLNAVWRNNRLWCTTTVMPSTGPDIGQATAHWMKLNTTNLTGIAIEEQGNIGGEDIGTGVSTFFPSISVNSLGDMVVGFSASGPTIYPGAYYVGKFSTDPANTILSSNVFKTGEDYYIRTLGGTRNRWGDFTGSSVDPLDDQTFYIFNQYAMTRGSLLNSEEGRWATCFGLVPSSVLPVEISSFNASIKENRVELKWTSVSEVNNYGFEVHRASINSNALWENVGFVRGNGNSNSIKQYNFVDESAANGKYIYRLKQIDNNGKFTYSKEIELNINYIPQEFSLSQNYPNPFNPTTVINYSIAKPGKVNISLYNTLGEKISVLLDEYKEIGDYKINFNARNLSSGIYFYQLRSETYTKTLKMLLTK